MFGDGHEYDWALEGDDDLDFREDLLKPEMKYQDVSFASFHPNTFSSGMPGLRTIRNSGAVIDRG